MGVIFLLQLFLIALAIVIGVLYAGWKLLDMRPRHVLAFGQVIGGVIVGSLSGDRWGEVFDTIRRNKLRTFLTAISVAWGIMVLVLLLGLGNGLNNGVRSTFRREAQNGIWISANKTSMPSNGYGIGRRITFENTDYDAAKQVDGVDH